MQPKFREWEAIPKGPPIQGHHYGREILLLPDSNNPLGFITNAPGDRKSPGKSIIKNYSYEKRRCIL